MRVNFIAIKKQGKTVHAVKTYISSLQAYCRELNSYGYKVFKIQADDVITCQNCIRELLKQDNIDLSVVVDKGKAKVTINN